LRFLFNTLINEKRTIVSKRLIIFIGVAVAIGAVAYYMMSGSGGQQGAGAPMGGMGQMPPTAVSTLQISKQSITREEQLPGRVSAFRQAEIRPQVEGIITKRLFEEGAYVEQGQALYQIDDTPYKAAVASARADLVSAEANLKAATSKEARFKELIKTSAVSGQVYDDAVAELERSKAAIAVANANIDVAQVNLDFTRVYAPISGRIGRSSVTEGALVTTNQSDSLTTITQLDPIFVDISQPGTSSMQLRSELAGRTDIPVEIILNSTTGQTHPHMGELKFSDVVVDETTGSVGLRALVPNPDQLLLPGLFVRTKINLGQAEVILVPQRATIRNPDGSLTVWVVDANNQVNPRPINVSSGYQDQWIVSSGIEEGETIIIEGYQKVRPGATVSPSPWVPAS